jgi:hypothetical protein
MLKGPMGVLIVLSSMTFAGFMVACAVAYFPARWGGNGRS